MKTVNASITTIGDELLIGQTIDTNSAWMGEELNKIGVWVKRRVAVGTMVQVRSRDGNSHFGQTGWNHPLGDFGRPR